MGNIYRLCFDLDGTICHTKTNNETYADVKPIDGMPELIRKLKMDGHYIIIMTARNMVTYNANIGKIIANQAPLVFEWLKKYEIPYDELLFGKPHADFFIDDKGVSFTTTKKLMEDLKL